MSDIAIRVENLSKYYKLGVINSGTLSRDLQSWIYKRLGKEDPNKIIGSYETDSEGFWALKDLNFEIKKGDRVGIIGRNGAGKSTLLKMLSQISSPTKGKIYIDGKIASLLEVGTGFNPELTGRENIYLNGAILGMKRKEVDRKIDEIIAFSEIERHIDTPVKRYSSGMYVRLAFAVAAHLDSDILIADEVLAVGDAAFQKKALGKMNELSTGEGRTVLFVSHNMAQVRNLCKNGLLLNKGVLELNSDIEHVINSYFSMNSNLEIKNNQEKIIINELNLIIQNVEMSKEISSQKEFFIKFIINNDSIEDYNDIGIQVMFFDDCGRRIITINPLETENIPCPIKKGKNIITCKIKKFPLCAGNYNIGLGIIKPNVKIYYLQEQFISFTIKEEIVNKRIISNQSAYGLFYPESEWTFE